MSSTLLVHCSSSPIFYPYDVDFIVYNPADIHPFSPWKGNNRFCWSNLLVTGSRLDHSTVSNFCRLKETHMPNTVRFYSAVFHSSLTPIFSLHCHVLPLHSSVIVAIQSTVRYVSPVRHCSPECYYARPAQSHTRDRA